MTNVDGHRHSPKLAKTGRVLASITKQPNAQTDGGLEYPSCNLRETFVCVLACMLNDLIIEPEDTPGLNNGFWVQNLRVGSWRYRNPICVCPGEL